MALTQYRTEEDSFARIVSVVGSGSEECGRLSSSVHQDGRIRK
jgi:hypothetical protein